jgi:FtsZ-binding cell division protein ZapB
MKPLNLCLLVFFVLATLFYGYQISQKNSLFQKTAFSPFSPSMPLEVKNFREDSLKNENKEFQHQKLELESENKRLREEQQRLQAQYDELLEKLKASKSLNFEKEKEKLQKTETPQKSPVSDSMLHYQKQYPRAIVLKGASLSKDPAFFKVLLMDSLSVEQKVKVMDSLLVYLLGEDAILKRPRNPVVAEEILFELEEHLKVSEDLLFKLLSDNQQEELKKLIRGK